MDLFNKTVYFSLFAQIIIGIVTLRGLFIQLPPQHAILTDALKLETVVQFIEAAFYFWMASGPNDIFTIASRRYIDWVITTPTMLISTIIFMKYREFMYIQQLKLQKQQNLNKHIPLLQNQKGDFNQNHQQPPLTLDYFLQPKQKKIIILICFYNLLMLLFGFLGEINIISKYVSIPVGFFFFYKVFDSLYYNYAIKSPLATKLFYVLMPVWALYGVAAFFNPYYKNISYNILDIFSKNFYGLYLYYYITTITNKL